MPVENVTSRQITLFLILTRVSVAISSMPVLDIPPYNQDIWIMILVSILFTLIIMSPLLYLAHKFTEYSVVGYMKIIYGKTIGKFIAILYGLYFISKAVDGITIQSELVATSLLTDSSNVTIIIVMSITTIYAASRGIIANCRVAEFLTPAAILIVMVMSILGLNTVNWSFLFPIFRTSPFMDIIMGAMRLTFYFSDILLLAMIIPELENKKDINKIFITSTIVSLLLLIITVFVVQGTIGIEMARHVNFPFLFYTRSISSFEIFKRIESIFVVGWLVTNLARVTAFIYLGTRVFREAMNKKEDEKIILFIVGIISGGISIYILNERSVIGVRKYFDSFYSILFVIFVVAIPILTTIVYFFRKKSLDKKEKPIS